MKNPFEIINEIEFNSIDQKFDNLNYNLKSIENFAIWIVGFSTGSIALIIGKIDYLKKTFSLGDLKLTLFLLVTSLILGIFFRYSIYQFQIYSQLTNQFLKNSLTKSNLPFIEGKDIANITDFNILIDRFKIDFDLDYSRYYQEYLKYDHSQKEVVIEDLKKRYNEIRLFLKQGYDEALENVRGIYKITYNFSDETSKKYFFLPQKTVAIRLHLWKKFADASFIISCLNFLIAIIIMAFKFK